MIMTQHPPPSARHALDPGRMPPSAGRAPAPARLDCTPPRPAAWALSAGARGMENQAVALAEAAGFAAVPVRLCARAPWRWLPERAWPLWGDATRRLGPAGDRVAPPWPDLVVACGRVSVPVAITIRRRSGGRTFVVQCQNPRVSPRRFDLVVPPEHDAMPPADNVVPILGAPNLALPWRLEAAREHWADSFAGLPRPLIAVAIGGSSRAYRMTQASLARLFAHLSAIRSATGAGFAITASRRTGPDAMAFIAREAARLDAWLWDGEGPTPILGLYALADAVVVTADSVNMAAEAAAAGKPVLIAGLEGGSAKFDRFHAALRAHGAARPLTGEFVPWTYPPLTETRRAAQAVRERMAARGFHLPPPRNWDAPPDRPA